MVYDPLVYYKLQKKDLARRLSLLEPLVVMYMYQYSNVSDAIRSIEAGELILSKLTERIEWCKKEMYLIANKYGDSYAATEVMKAMVYYMPIVSASYADYNRVKRAMEDLVEGGRILAEIREKLEDLYQDMENIEIAMEMQRL